MNTAAPHPTDLAHQIPADAYHHLIHTLRRALPPPPTDTPADRVRRDHAAIACIAALCPTNAAEADLAAHFVAASEHAKEYLRLAQVPDITPERAAKCSVHGHSMMRLSLSALRLLHRLQAMQHKQDADPATHNRRAWTEHQAMRLMADALSPQPAPAQLAELGDVAETPAAACAPRREPAIPDPPSPAPEPQSPPAMLEDSAPDRVAAAEEYAALYPERAALIRAAGRVPNYAMFDPPDDDLVQALITVRTPTPAALGSRLPSV